MSTSTPAMMQNHERTVISKAFRLCSFLDMANGAVDIDVETRAFSRNGCLLQS